MTELEVIDRCQFAIDGEEALKMVKAIVRKKLEESPVVS